MAELLVQKQPLTHNSHPPPWHSTLLTHSLPSHSINSNPMPWPLLPVPSLANSRHDCSGYYCR